MHDVMENHHRTAPLALTWTTGTRDNDFEIVRKWIRRQVVRDNQIGLVKTLSTRLWTGGMAWGEPLAGDP
jgi:hypothetical protein